MRDTRGARIALSASVRAGCAGDKAGLPAVLTAALARFVAVLADRGVRVGLRSAVRRVEKHDVGSLANAEGKRWGGVGP